MNFGQIKAKVFQPASIEMKAIFKESWDPSV